MEQCVATLSQDSLGIGLDLSGMRKVSPLHASDSGDDKNVGTPHGGFSSCSLSISPSPFTFPPFLELTISEEAGFCPQSGPVNKNVPNFSSCKKECSKVRQFKV